MKLHENKELFTEIIEGAAEYFNFDPSHIEKDYWVSKMLKEVSNSEYGNQAFFKGGTSLSKAFGLIKRFSEDLDMLAYTGDVKASKSKEKLLNKKISDIITFNNEEIFKPELSKTGGNFRKNYFEYDNNFEKNGLKQHLEVEIKACDFPDKTQIYYPTDKRTIAPIVGEFLDKIGRQDLMNQYGLEPFTVNCINPRKTVCDKISRLVKLSYRDNPIEEFSKHIRDLYDLHAILSVKEYKDFLHSDDFLEALYRTTLEDQLMKNSKTDNPLDEAVIFKDTNSILENPTIQRAYKNGLGALFFNNEKMPELTAIHDTIKDISKRLESFEAYRKERAVEESKTEVVLSSISIYPGLNGEKMFIRFKVNGEQMPAVELNAKDKSFFERILQEGTKEEKENSRLYLADKYYQNNYADIIKKQNGIKL